MCQSDHVLQAVISNLHLLNFQKIMVVLCYGIHRIGITNKISWYQALWCLSTTITTRTSALRHGRSSNRHNNHLHVVPAGVGSFVSVSRKSYFLRYFFLCLVNGDSHFCTLAILTFAVSRQKGHCLPAKSKFPQPHYSKVSNYLKNSNNFALPR